MSPPRTKKSPASAKGSSNPKAPLDMSTTPISARWCLFPGTLQQLLTSTSTQNQLETSMPRKKKSPASTKGNSNPTVPSAPLGGVKRCAPVRPPLGNKHIDYTNKITAIKCQGSIVVINVKKASSEPAFKIKLKNADPDGKEGIDQLGITAVLSHK